MANDLKIKIKVDSNTGELVVTKNEFNKLGKVIDNTKKHADNFTKRLTQMAHAGVAIYGINKAFDILLSTVQDFTKTSMQFEKFETVLKTIEGSSKKAQASMDWISKFAANTPYQLEQVTESFVKLKAYGLDATKDLRTLGDTASAMGKPMMQAVEAMADAVVGENERLKEFGIKAKKQGNEIAYNWVTASGEAKHIVVKNNQAIIESTLLAIFNSKYTGAMESQSKTLAGMLSNIQDNYTKFQKNIMDGGLYAYLKSLVDLFGKKMQESFGKAVSGGQIWANTIIDAINGVIKGFGFLHDAVIGIRLVFTAVETAVLGISRAIMWALNKPMEALQHVVDAYNWTMKKLDVKFKGKSLATTFKMPKIDTSWTDNAIKDNIKSMQDDVDTLLHHSGYKFAKNLVAEVKKAAPKVAAVIDDAIKPVVSGAKDGTFLGFKAKGHKKLYAQELSEAQKIKDDILALGKKYIKDEETQYKNYYNKIGDYAKEWEILEAEIRKNNKYLTEKELNNLVGLNKTEFYDKIKKQRYANYEQAKKDQKAYEYDQLKSYGTIADGFAYYSAQKMPSDFETGINIMKDLTSSVGDAWTNFFDKQSSAFRDFGKLGKSIINDIEKQILKTQIVAPLTTATTSILGSVGSSIVSSLFDGWADGGYTYRDSSNKTPVGVVHANEYVIPANMVKSHPSLVAGLEAERRGLKPFWSGGSASDDATSSGFGGLGNGDSFGGISSTSGVQADLYNRMTDALTKNTKAVKEATIINNPSLNHMPDTYINATIAEQIGKQGYANNGLVGLQSSYYDESISTAASIGIKAIDTLKNSSSIVGKVLGYVGDLVFGGSLKNSGQSSDEQRAADLAGFMSSGSIAKTSNTPTKSNTLNTSGYINDMFSGDGGGFYSTYAGQTVKQATADIKAKLEEANKKDIIDATKDIWKGMLDVIPTIKTDATGDWTTLFNNYIKDGNSALLKTALDGSLFNTPDFYTSWETYAKNLNESVQKALSDKLGELTTNTRTFKEWQFGFNGDTTGALKYKADYLADDLKKLEDSMGVTGISVENFYTKQKEAIAKNFTPQEIDKWKQLGDALMSASDAQKELQNAQADYVQSIANAVNTLRAVSAQNVSTFQNSFKSDTQKAADLAHAVNQELVTSYEALNVVFRQLAEDSDGLTNAELAYLNANKTYIEQRLQQEKDSQKEMLQTQLNGLNSQKTNFNNMLSSLVSDISSLDGILNSIGSIIDKLNGAIIGSSYSLQKYYNSMRETLALSNGSDYKAYSGSLSDTVSAATALFDSSNFSSQYDQKFAQAVAANQFNGMEVKAETQIDYLRQIEANTRGQLTILAAQITAATTAVNNVASTISTQTAPTIPTPTVVADIIAPVAQPSYTDGEIYDYVNGVLDVMGITADSVTRLRAEAIANDISAYRLDSIMGWGRGVSNQFAEKYGLTPFADGGIVTAPTVGFIGEAGYSEAVIPLKDPNDPLSQKELIKKIDILIDINEKQARRLERIDRRDERIERSA